ncbi:MAG: thiamine diphosphokinase [Oscillospiraceae bacterium]|jgi:thiamine pyrophosphokinase|nr:thiamine diphosphokinase [Oscillospiraceae bacterium]
MEQKVTCMVIGSVPMQKNIIFNEYKKENCYVICADGGLDNANRFQISPDLLIGDFDSYRGELPGGVETIRLKVEKDETDTLAAVKEGIRRGFRSFVLFGELGGERFDHSYGNLCVLQYLCHQGCKAVLIGENCRLFLLSGGRLSLNGMKGSTVSVFPFGCSACRVSYIGMKYPLTKTVLHSDNPLGVSNRIEAEEARIAIHDGDALIIIQA